MKIDSIETLPYSLTMSKPFITSKEAFNKRDGYIIKIISDEYVGFGDVSPLPNFSSESIKDTIYGIELFKKAVQDANEISKYEFIEMIKIYLDNLPSAQFGINSSFVDLLSKKNELPFAKYLNKNYSNIIYTNGLEHIHNPEDNFPIIKVKVGFRNLFDELENLEYLTKNFGEKIKFRLDANEQFDLPRAIRYCKEMERFNIDYIEQPLPKYNYEDLYELSLHTKIKIAVDESVTDINSVHKIIDNQAAEIIIVKPMLTGSIRNIQNIFDLARDNNIRIIITSTLESNIGVTTCMHLASAFNVKEPCGLSTGKLYNDNFNSIIKISNGEIVIPNIPGIGIEKIDVN